MAVVGAVETSASTVLPRSAAVEAADPRDLMAWVGGLSRSEIEAMSADEAEALVVGCNRVTAAVDARRALAMDTLASRVDEDVQRRAQQKREDDRARTQARAATGQDGHGGGAGHDRGDTFGVVQREPGPDVHGLVASGLAPALHCSTRAVRQRLEADRVLVCTTEATFQAHWDGDLERHRADAVAGVAQHVDPDLWERFEAMVLETTVDQLTGEVTLVSDEVKGLSRAQLARRAARIARTLDPDSERQAAKRAHDQRRVLIRPDRHAPGLATWTAHLPSEVSQRMGAAVDALAGQYAKANPGTRLDGHRADALADLVLGNAEVKTVVELLVPVMPAQDVAKPTTGALGQLNPVTVSLVPPGTDGPDTNPSTTIGPGPSPADDQAVSWIIPGQVDDPRHGALLPEVIAGLLADPDVVIRLARLDPDGSITQDPTAYRPSASTRRRVRSRDGHCRFPGCHAPATRCDLDHVVPHPHGPTEHTNLIALCRTHHRFKHHAGWKPTLTPDGIVTWAASDGRTWTTHPTPHDVRAQLSLLQGLDPDTAHDLRRGWLPGLPPGMSLADLTVAEHQLTEDPPDTDVTPEPPPDWQSLDWQSLDWQACDESACDQSFPPAWATNIKGFAGPSALERHIETLLAIAA